MADDGQRGRQKVLIAGAGPAGLEAALALRGLAGERVEVTLHDPRREFAYRPFGIGEPYGTTRSFHYDLRRFGELCGASLEAGAIAAVEPVQRIAVTREGKRLPFDHLIVATGARMLWAVAGAVTYWGVSDEGQVGDLLADLRAGRLRRLVFTMPAGPSWVLPLYELALLAATVLERAGNDRTRLTVVTPEGAPLEIFGRRAVEQTASLLSDRHIDVVAGAAPIAFEAGSLRTNRGESVEADAVITLPRLEGRRIGGIPHDEGGFVAVDEHSAVVGLERIYAAGDVSSLPFKQGAFSTEQADCAAEAIAAAAGSGIEPRASGPTMRAVLWTDQGPRYLAGMRDDAGVSGPSERHLELLHNGRVSARYLTPLVDSLLASADFQEGGGALAEAPQRG